MICKELGKEPDPDKMPVDFNTLCTNNQLAVTIFSRLSNKIVPEVGYVGKDYSNIEFLCKLYEVKDVRFLLDLISVMDAHHIEQSNKARQDSLNKMKRSGR